VSLWALLGLEPRISLSEAGFSRRSHSAWSLRRGTSSALGALRGTRPAKMCDPFCSQIFLLHSEESHGLRPVLSPLRPTAIRLQCALSPCAASDCASALSDASLCDPSHDPRGRATRPTPPLPARTQRTPMPRTALGRTRSRSSARRLTPLPRVATRLLCVRVRLRVVLPVCAARLSTTLRSASAVR